MDKGKENLDDSTDLLDVGSNPNTSGVDKSFLINTLNENRITLALLLIGLTLVGMGFFYNKFDEQNKSAEVILLDGEGTTSSDVTSIFVEIAGAVEKPGVYELSDGSRVEDLLVSAGGLADGANKEWVEKYVNRASLLSDGQKIYIPNVNEQTDDATANAEAPYQSDTSVLGSEGSTIVNINTATQSELEELWGIGPVYAQKIIEHRPYSSIEELREKDVIKSNVYEKNKELMAVY